ncbi:hypothetical protein SNOG_09454 [Parastagonospora nodorum SN15]|uniref:Uncharacterized protein n=1 Tax=Phaeosphaeria nodorum (strain SN15 / ATCC MYA-4574 / FGSC 10173) TaxID=321614 RepID=Q0UFL0_PHANO|nr:hypothetical protein SNOG_09454 [Parastagonospora nodorum SN15]EAT82719.1 hypothetical protein SNOG_09454 [Parastagonospora nodorum SN15]
MADLPGTGRIPPSYLVASVAVAVVLAALGMAIVATLTWQYRELPEDNELSGIQANVGEAGRRDRLVKGPYEHCDAWD